MLIDNDSYEQEDLLSEEVEVTICLSLSKTVKVCVDDYRYEEDEEGKPHIDFSKCDLKKAVEEQIVMPHELTKYAKDIFNKVESKYVRDVIKDCDDWCVDDFEVILE